MTAVRFYLDRWYATLLVVALASFLSYDLADHLARMADQPGTLQELAGRQLESVILAGAAGAAFAALLAARHHHRRGRDYTVTAARAPLRRAGIQFLAASAPLGAAWLLFVAVSGVRSGVARAAVPAVAVVVVSLAALAVSVAIGQLAGTLLRPLLAVPAAFLVSYLTAAIASTLGDDSWIQWLGTGFGDSLTGTVQATWIAGELLWFTGLTLALLGAGTLATSNPSRLPALFTAATALLLVSGSALLRFNGADASLHDVGLGP